METKESINTLINLGEPETSDWIKYSDIGITEEDIPELIEVLKNKEYGFDSEDNIKCWGQLHAWRALGELKSKEAISSLLAHLDDDDYSGWASEEIPEVFGMIGKDCIEPLRDYIFDKSKPECSRITAAHGYEYIGKQNQEVKEDCIKVLCDFLEQTTEESPDLNGFAVSFLVDLEAVNAIDTIRQAYEKDLVNCRVTGDLEEVEMLLGLREKRETPNPNYNQFLGHAPIVKEKKVGRNEPCTCGSGKKYKKCCLK